MSAVRKRERRSSLPQHDNDQYGWTPYARLYQCLQGYLCVYCVDDAQQDAMRRVVLGPDRAVSEDLAGDFMFELFGQPATAWVEILRSAGVPCAEVAEESWLLRYLVDEQVIASGRATRFEHPQHGLVSVIGRMVQLEGYRPLEPVRAPFPIFVRCLRRPS